MISLDPLNSDTSEHI